MLRASSEPASFSEPPLAISMCDDVSEVGRRHAATSGRLSVQPRGPLSESGLRATSRAMHGNSGSFLDSPQNGVQVDRVCSQFPCDPSIDSVLLWLRLTIRAVFPYNRVDRFRSRGYARLPEPCTEILVVFSILRRMVCRLIGFAHSFRATRRLTVCSYGSG